MRMRCMIMWTTKLLKALLIVWYCYTYDNCHVQTSFPVSLILRPHSAFLHFLTSSKQNGDVGMRLLPSTMHACALIINH